MDTCHSATLLGMLNLQHELKAAFINSHYRPSARSLQPNWHPEKYFEALDPQRYEALVNVCLPTLSSAIVIVEPFSKISGRGNGGAANVVSFNVSDCCNGYCLRQKTLLCPNAVGPLFSLAFSSIHMDLGYDRGMQRSAASLRKRALAHSGTICAFDRLHQVDHVLNRQSLKC